MPYKKKGRPSWYTNLKTETGWWTGVALPAPATPAGKPLAARIEQMWDTLAREHRAWDVLEAVRAGRWSLGRLYDAWVETKQDVHAVRRRLNDADLSLLRDGFLVVYDKQVRSEDSKKRMRRHLAALFGIEDGVVTEPLLASEATPAELTSRLYEYGAGEAGPATLRVVHASWSVFFDHAREVKCVIADDPMERVPRPTATKEPVQFYELETIERIVDWQPTDRRRALFALTYGCPIEISVALTLTRADVHPATREVRAPGTKAHTRDRVLRVDDWAWERFWSYARDMLPATRIFDGIDRHRASKWHRASIGVGERGFANQYREADAHEGLKLERRIKMYAARHAWAVRHLRAGTPIAVVQQALGHATAKETLDTYGAFVPTGADRDHWQRETAKAEQRRREAK